MAATGESAARKAGNRGTAAGFEWVSSSPSPATVVELEARFPEVVQIPGSVLEAAGACWKEHALLARTFHRWVQPEAFVREFRRAGISGDIQTVCLAHRCYVFRFENLEARELVAGRPWVVNGQPVAIEDWRPEFVPAVDSLSSALLWVRMPSLPMEFWSDEILAAIVQPAGQFVCSDPATRALSRGTFARACLRIDLRRPLRPGVRVQGVARPFWQQFQYEHLVGICPCCGSIHLNGACSQSSSPTETESSSSGPLFGPWMSATRQRKSPAPLQQKTPRASPVAAGIPSAGVSQPGSVNGGWAALSKVARRRSVKPGNLRDGVMGVLDLPSEGLTHGISVPGGISATVTVPVENQRAGSLVTMKPNSQTEHPHSLNSVIQSFKTNNPFALLDTGNGDCRPLVRVDVNPGPSKRARPEESLSHRSVSKGGKRKGKGVNLNSKELKDKVSYSEAMITGSSMGSLAPSSDSASGSQVIGLGVEMGMSSMGQSRSHDSVLACLKLAIKDQAVDSILPTVAIRASVSAADAGTQEADNILMDCNNQTEGGGSRSDGLSSDLTMVVDQGGIHPPPQS